MFGYIPKEAFEKIATETGLRLSDMYGVATFYAQFRLNPVGKHIVKVCHGTACHVQNAKAVSDALQEALGVEDGGTTEDGLVTLESVACLGCCSLAPVMMIGDETYGKLSGSEAVKIVKNIRIQEKQLNNLDLFFNRKDLNNGKHTSNSRTWKLWNSCRGKKKFTIKLKH